VRRIIIEDIHKSFGDPQVKVLDGINMTLYPGITCLMGPSGTGKTTLARILAGLTAPDVGSITWEGCPLTQPATHKRIGYVFQEDRLLTWETALANLLFVDVQNNQSRAVELLNQAGLAESIHKKTAELSGGMQRRVALCRALMNHHDLLILDEPFKGLDDDIKKTAINMVRAWHGDHPESIILCITHDDEEVNQLGG